MDTILEELQACRKRTREITRLNTFVDRCDQVVLDRDRFVRLPKEMLGISGKLISELDRQDCQVFLWEIDKDQEYIIDDHYHSYSNEILCVLQGEIVRLEDNKVLRSDTTEYIEAGKRHSYLFKRGTKLLVIFTPSIKVSFDDGY